MLPAVLDLTDEHWFFIFDLHHHTYQDNQHSIN